MASQSQRDGFGTRAKSTLTRVRVISSRAFGVRHCCFKHSSTSGLQWSGINETDDPEDEGTDGVSATDD